MSRINRKLEYALMALKYMSEKRPGELTSAKEVSDSVHSPFDATARVMQVMSQNEILRAEYGVNGGYQIIRDLGRISIHELMELIDGKTAIVKCLSEESESCDLRKTCNIFSPISNLNQRMTDFLSYLTVKDLLMDEQKTKRTPRGVLKSGDQDERHEAKQSKL